MIVAAVAAEPPVGHATGVPEVTSVAPTSVRTTVTAPTASNPRIVRPSGARSFVTVPSGNTRYRVVGAASATKPAPLAAAETSASPSAGPLNVHAPPPSRLHATPRGVTCSGPSPTGNPAGRATTATSGFSAGSTSLVVWLNSCT